jgi:heme-degrading monooxygenase HmoA
MTVYRIDRFIVPDESLEEFLAGLPRTHELLQQQPGFEYDLALRGERSAGTTRVMTLVAWADDDAVTAARRVVAARNEEVGFTPADTFARLGIDAELGMYAPVGPPPSRTNLL